MSEPAKQEKAEKSKKDDAPEETEQHHPRHHHHHHHHKKHKNEEKEEHDAEDEGDDERPSEHRQRHRSKEKDEHEQEEDTAAASIGEGYAGDTCHNMELGDTCTACFCPCISYGQILESLDPNVKQGKKKRKGGSSCHVSTGCLLWTGLMGLTAGGFQSLISVPGIFDWMPTMHFANLVDARELFLTCGYFIPQWLCHLPLRTSIMGGKRGENCCCSCLITSFCSCCSLSSLKAWGQENRAKYTEDDVCLSKCCPCCGVLDKKNYHGLGDESIADEGGNEYQDNEEEEEESDSQKKVVALKARFSSYPPLSVPLCRNNFPENVWIQPATLSRNYTLGRDCDTNNMRFY